MLSSSALVAGLLALRASAFLLPLEVTKAAEQAQSDLESFFSSTRYVVDLDCPGCPFAGVEGQEPQWVDDVENKIHLEFATNPQGHLTINGQSIIAERPHSGLPTIPVAPQVRVEDGEWSAPMPLDFALERSPSVTSEEDPDIEIVPLQFTVLGLNGHPVKVDTISIDLLQTSAQTTVAKIATIPFAETPGATTCTTPSTWSLCRLRAIIVARMQAVVAAAQSHASAAKDWMKAGCKGQRTGLSGKHHKEHHKEHHKDHHHKEHHNKHHHKKHHLSHRLAHMLHQALRFFVVPALLGVIGGLMASSVGMLVGHIIVYLWLRFHRNGQRGPLRVVQTRVETDNKDALIFEEESAPPQYRDVEAVVGEEKGEKPSTI